MKNKPQYLNEVIKKLIGVYVFVIKSESFIKRRNVEFLINMPDICVYVFMLKIIYRLLIYNSVL